MHCRAPPVRLGLTDPSSEKRGTWVPALDQNFRAALRNSSLGVVKDLLSETKLLRRDLEELVVTEPGEGLFE